MTKKELKMFDVDEQLDAAFGKEGTTEREAAKIKANTLFIGQVIEQARRKAAITQTELAKKIGTDRAYISRVEAGEIDPTVSTFYRIASALGLNVELMSNPIVKIESEIEYKAICQRIEELLPMTGNDTPVTDRSFIELKLISDLAADYDEEHYPMGKPSLVGLIELRMYEMEISKDQLPALVGIDPLRIDAIMQNKDNPTTHEIALIGKKLTIDPNNCTINRTVEVIVEQSGDNLSAYIEGAPIITVGDDLKEIELNMKEAIELYLEDNTNPIEILTGDFELSFKLIQP